MPRDARNEFLSEAYLDISKHALHKLARTDFDKPCPNFDACMKLFLAESRYWNCATAAEFRERGMAFVDEFEQRNHGAHAKEINASIQRAIRATLPNQAAVRYMHHEGGLRESTTGLLDDLTNNTWEVLLESVEFRYMTLERKCAYAHGVARNVARQWREREQYGLKTLPVSQMELPIVDNESLDGAEEERLPWDEVTHTQALDPSIEKLLTEIDQDERMELFSSLDTADQEFLCRYEKQAEENHTPADIKRYAHLRGKWRDMATTQPDAKDYLTSTEAAQRYYEKQVSKGNTTVRGKIRAPRRQRLDKRLLCATHGMQGVTSVYRGLYRLACGCGRILSA